LAEIKPNYTYIYYDGYIIEVTILVHDVMGSCVFVTVCLFCFF